MSPELEPELSVALAPVDVAALVVDAPPEVVLSPLDDPALDPPEPVSVADPVVDDPPEAVNPLVALAPDPLLLPSSPHAPRPSPSAIQSLRRDITHLRRQHSGVSALGGARRRAYCGISDSQPNFTSTLAFRFPWIFMQSAGQAKILVGIALSS